ncbi:hypothetical protein CNR22_00865 [Sphingobacteriaceae bacterium]|nr:hypothetical protein CNR22_00865 [Sphingobacteriaceae bacterium]
MKKSYQLVTTFIVLLSMITLKMGAQISGIVTINAAAPASATNYTSFTSLATTLNSGGINGPLTVNVTNGTYTEQVTFNQITGASATNTITINGNNSILTFNSTSTAPHTLLLNGTDYLNVNNLHMMGTNTTYAIIALLTNQANYNNFTACTFSAPANGTSSSQCPFAFSSSATGISCCGDPGNNNTVKTSTLVGGYYGIYHYGASSGAYTHDNSFLNCYMTDFYYYGVYCYYSKNLTIKGCKIDRLTRTTFTTTYLLYGYGSQGMVLDGNIYEKLYNGNTAYTGTLYGLAYVGSYNPMAQDVNPCRVTNNVFRDINFNGTIYAFYYSYYSDTKFLHNTLSFDHTAATGGSTYGFYYIYGGNGMYASVMNNNISITRGGTGTKYGFYNGGTSLTGVVVNNNNYYVNSLGGNNYIGYVTAQANSMGTWTTQGVDANGSNLDPQYVSLATGDLHPTNATMNNTGAPVGVAMDVLGAPRSQQTPDVGAYEFLSNVCAATPTNISVNTPTYAICPGSSANINVNGYTSDLGVTYQWLSSTSSSVGPWTVVSGANTVLYTTPNLNATTFYGVAVSCTLVGTTATVANVINIAATTTSVVPYFESFEGINKADELPNCSWYAPGTGPSLNTYTSSNTQGRNPRTGTKFGVFNYMPYGQAHVYTNGIYLNAGVTYSASVWYQTEYYGYNNWTDLSILYSTTQTTTGAVSIASTGGPAISNVYKQLSNTFTVATSGMYYIDVRATSASGSYAYYLSWDDLSITIPCALNQPTVTLNTNTTTICAGDEFTSTASGADTYTWSNGSNSNSISETPASNIAYTLWSTNALSGCTSTITQMVNVNPAPSVFITANSMSICAGQVANLNAIGNAISYVWSNNNTSPNISVSPTVTTNYSVTGTNNYGCDTEASVMITVKNAPVITVSTSQPNEMCAGEPQTLTAGGGVSYQWVSGGTGAISQGASIVISPLVSTVYSVTGTDANGCTSKAAITQNVSQCLGLKVNGLKGLSVYPNPASSELTVTLPDNSDKIITVIDLTGRVLSSNSSSKESTKIDLSNFANGIYYVKIQSNSSSEVVKIVKH